MDKQATFDKVLAHVRQQGKPAMVSGFCAYRAEDGGKCAVGALIPDELMAFNPSFQGGVNTLLSERPEIAEFFGILPFDVEGHPTSMFLTALQRCHDGGSDMWTTSHYYGWTDEERLSHYKRSFEGAMSKLADTYLLNYTAP